MTAKTYIVILTGCVYVCSISSQVTLHSECDALTERVLMTSGKDNQSQGDASQVNGLQTEELMQLREELEELRKQQALLQIQLGDKDALINTLVSRSPCAVCSSGAASLCFG